MSRHVAEKENIKIVYGYDAPCNGYFAFVFDKNLKDDEPIENHGFVEGINNTKLIEVFEKYEMVSKISVEHLLKLMFDVPI